MDNNSQPLKHVELGNIYSIMLLTLFSDLKEALMLAINNIFDYAQDHKPLA